MDKIESGNQRVDGSQSVARDSYVGGDLRVQGDAVVGHNLRVDGYVEAANVRGPEKGMWRSVALLEGAYPVPADGWYALVGDDLPATVYMAYGGRWIEAGQGGSVTLPEEEFMEIWRNLNQKIDAETARDEFSPIGHTHRFADLTGTPTTLAGYGITDAKIENGVIRLGNVTITPLTSHQSLAAYLTIENAKETYLSQTDAAATYQPKGNYLTSHQSLAAYLTIENAKETYLSQTDAAAKYQPKGNYLTSHQSLAAYLTIENAKETYLSQTDAAAKYQPKGNYLTSHQSLAAYLTIENAKETYLSQTDAAATYQPKGNYLTSHQSLAAYLTIENAKTTYQPKGNYLTSHQSLDDYVTISKAETITGKKTFQGGVNIQFDRTTSNAKNICWVSPDGTSVVHSITGHNTGKAIIINPIGKSETWNDVAGNYSLYVGENKLTYNTKALLREDNYATYLNSVYEHEEKLVEGRDYVCKVILLWKHDEKATHRVTGQFFTTPPSGSGGMNRHQFADVDLWFARWGTAEGNMDSYYKFETGGVGSSMMKLVTCMYEGEKWWAVKAPTTAQAVSVWFRGFKTGVTFKVVEYYNTSTKEELNAEINGSIEDRTDDTASLDSEYVTLEGAQSIAGIKTFTNGFRLRTDTTFASTDRMIPFTGTGDYEGVFCLYNNNDSTGFTYNPASGAVKAGSFVKRGGTSSQVLKADGSVISYAKSGAYFNAIPFISSDGVMEIGKYIDFHEATTSTADYTVRLSSSGSKLLVNGNVAWHSGNDGKGSDLDAGKLEGLHAGVTNGSVATYVSFPTHSELVTLGYNTDEGEISNPAYLQGLCKWAIDTYANQGRVILIGYANPNYGGLCEITLYSDGGKSAETGLPRYCEGRFYSLNGEIIPFGTNEYVWRYASGTYQSNAATASKLKTARSIFGQSFDGSANITGALSGVTDVAMSGQLKSTCADGTAPMTVASKTRVTNLNADMVDGYHASPTPSVTSVAVHDEQSHLRFNAFKYVPRFEVRSEPAGWYRIYESDVSDATGHTVLIGINRTWNKEAPESYLFAVSVSTVSQTAGTVPPSEITQLAGYASNRKITKLRIIQKFNTKFYIEYYKEESDNSVNVWGLGRGVFMTPTLQEGIPEGYSVKEFETVNGFANQSGVHANAETASKLKESVTLWGNTFDGSGNVGGNLQLDEGAAGRQLTISTGGGITFRAGTQGWAWGMSSLTSTNTSLGTSAGSYGSGDKLDYHFYGGSYSSPSMVILPSGYVGINTTKPTYRFQVSGTVAATKLVALSGSGVYLPGETSGGKYYGTFIRNDGANIYWMLSDAADTQQDAYNAGYNTLRPLTINNSTGNIHFCKSTLKVVHPVAGESFGKVGVGGNTSPKYPLDVNGAVNATGDIMSSTKMSAPLLNASSQVITPRIDIGSADQSGAMVWDATNGAIFAGCDVRISGKLFGMNRIEASQIWMTRKSDDWDGSGMYITGGATGGMAVNIYNSNGEYEGLAVQINHDGNIGLGVSAAHIDAKLHVNGTTHTTDLKIGDGLLTYDKGLLKLNGRRLTREGYVAELTSRPGNATVIYTDPDTGEGVGFEVGMMARWPDAEMDDGWGMAIVKSVTRSVSGSVVRVGWYYATDIEKRLKALESLLAETEPTELITEDDN